ncbi:MAG: HAD-IIB family hydrolase [Akkermansiaceae bacterium]|nr:HAD-IIB family hydrolase [Akkermansiaceae bacterium]
MSWYQNWMAVTDLDGTLLDHDDYSWQPAAKAVATLKEHEVPLVLASSKTLAEMRLLATELGIHQPMIVENGAAVAWPSEEEGEDYRVEAMGSPRDELIEVIHQLREENGWEFSGFADWSAEEVAEDCGLDLERAELARQRHGTEPLVWEDTEDAYAQFLVELESQDLRAVRGGRYIHVMGEFDKADGLRAVAETFGKGSATPLRIIAFGDSPNDEAMLCAADVAVRIRSRKSSEMKVQAPVLLQPEQPGPYGWAEAFEEWWSNQGAPQSTS